MKEPQGDSVIPKIPSPGSFEYLTLRLNETSYLFRQYVEGLGQAMRSKEGNVVISRLTGFPKLTEENPLYAAMQRLCGKVEFLIEHARDDPYENRQDYDQIRVIGEQAAGILDPTKECIYEGGLEFKTGRLIGEAIVCLKALKVLESTEHDTELEGLLGKIVRKTDEGVEPKYSSLEELKRREITRYGDILEAAYTGLEIVRYSGLDKLKDPKFKAGLIVTTQHEIDGIFTRPFLLREIAANLAQVAESIGKYLESRHLGR